MISSLTLLKIKLIKNKIKLKINISTQYLFRHFFITKINQRNGEQK